MDIVANVQNKYMNKRKCFSNTILRDIFYLYLGGKFMYNFRTDMADERRDIYKKANNLESDIPGIQTIEKSSDENIKSSIVKILNEEGEKAIGKPIGTYVTFDVKI